MDNDFLIALLIAGPIAIYFLLRFSAQRRLNRTEVARQWNNVRQLANGESSQFAIVEADKVFDNVLKQLGYRGNTAGERLKSAGRSLRNENQVWQAHKLRNRIVHDSDVKLSKTEVKSALASFEKALRSLGAL